MKYGVASWPEDFGNHRAVVKVNERADAVRIRVPWRRHDDNPHLKGIIVVDSATGEQIKNAAGLEINSEYGDIIFQPKTVPGDYYIYYMPHTCERVFWNWVTKYNPPQDTADPAWLSCAKADIPQAEVAEIQARGEHHRFDPMEIIATEQEIAALIADNPSMPYLLFPEDRLHHIKMKRIPERWAQCGAFNEFKGEAARGEFYAFQIGVFAAERNIDDVDITCCGLKSSNGNLIPPSAIRCINKNGIDWLGRPIEKRFSVDKGNVRAMWFGVDVPEDAVPGEYAGEICLKPDGLQESSVDIKLVVSNEVIEDHGDNDPWRMSRLRWLDSTIGLEDTVTAPYVPVECSDGVVKVLGREIVFGENGLPNSIKSGDVEILARPVEVAVETPAGLLGTGNCSRKQTAKTDAYSVRESSGSVGEFEYVCNAKTDYDGYTIFSFRFKARRNIYAKDIRFEIPIKKEIAVYMMGMGWQGGCRAEELEWKWDIGHANNQLWIGDVDAGIYIKLKDSQDTWDMFDFKINGLPESWHNGGKGGCKVSEEGDEVVIRAYSGERELEAGEEIEFRFSMIVTPVKPLDNAHWTQRYYQHEGEMPSVEEIAGYGVNIINIHQGSSLNPYINYPFMAAEKMGAYIKQAHDAGCKAKIYYTVRELSNYATELWALRSMEYDVLADGPGGGDAWLIEHLGNNYVFSWHQPLSDGGLDAAIKTTSLSRWHNYYLEGLSWLVKNVGIDGLYLDGIGYDREIMRRVRRVLDEARQGCLMDFHSGNEYIAHDWRISAAVKQMEHLPYIDSLWFGEGYQYEKGPDYWLVEVSGIPFGLYSEMLQDGGNPWRGMIYGMTNRLGWHGDPRNIWKLWDSFGIQESKMIGYWEKQCPVRTNHKDILATVYVKKDKALVALASWAPELAACELDIDWNMLGLDRTKVRAYLPEIECMQEEAEISITDKIELEHSKGLMLILE